MNQSDLFSRMQKAVLEGNKEEAAALARAVVKEGLNLNEVIEKGYTPGIHRAGELWEKGEYFLPELISSAESMKAAMAVLQPEIQRTHLQIQSPGRVVIGTVEGDIHDIGKNLVSAMLSASGFDVIDLGADVKLETMIEKAVAEKADFVCLSALLTTTMLGQKRFIEMVKARGLRGRFKVLVGGAPVTQKWAGDIGADGYGENAVAAVKLAKSLAGKADA